MLTGSLVALITPMHADGSVNFEQLNQLIDWHIANGTHGIVAVGTTGESATLSVDEHLAVIAATVKHVNKRVPVIAGTGANNTHEAVALSHAAKEAGADYTLSVVPYYNKPSQEGIYQHFKTITQEVDIPMIIYNVPGRTVVNMSNETILRLAQLPNIVGVKEASGDVRAHYHCLKMCLKILRFIRVMIPRVCHLCCAVDMASLQSPPTLLPKYSPKCVNTRSLAISPKPKKFNNQLIPIYNVMFCEPSPAPAKFALAQLSLCAEHVRLPITTLTDNGKTKVQAALKAAQLI